MSRDVWSRVGIVGEEVRYILGLVGMHLGRVQAGMHPCWASAAYLAQVAI